MEKSSSLQRGAVMVSTEIAVFFYVVFTATISAVTCWFLAKQLEQEDAWS